MGSPTFRGYSNGLPKFNNYKDNNLKLLLSMSGRPSFVQVGSNKDLWNGLGIGGYAYAGGATTPRDHYTPGILGFGNQIASGGQSFDNKEELPHTLLQQQGMQPLSEMATDFLLGGESAQGDLYFKPGSFEHTTHGMFKAGNANHGRYVEIGGGAKRHEDGAEYWMEKFGRGLINQQELNTGLQSVRDRQLAARNDDYYDDVWANNYDSYANTLKDWGVTDGSDLAHATGLVLNPLGRVLDLKDAKDRVMYGAFNKDPEQMKAGVKYGARAVLGNDGYKAFSNYRNGNFAKGNEALKKEITNRAHNISEGVLGTSRIAKSVVSRGYSKLKSNLGSLTGLWREGGIIQICTM